MPKARRLPDVSFFNDEASAATTAVGVANLFAGGSSAEAPPQRIPIPQLQDNPFQPRRVLDQSSLAELASVIKSQGFQGVLVARPHPHQPGMYELAFGHRRREAARLAGFETLPVIVQPLTNEDMITLAITENIQRSDLTPLEEGDTYRLMIDQLGYKQEQIAQEIGKDRGYVVNRLRAARAPDDVRALVAAKPDTLRAVAYLIKITDLARRAELIAQLQAGLLTGDELPDVLAPPPDPVPSPSLADGRLRRAAASRGAASSEAAADIRPRVGNSKLRGIVRTLTLYRGSLLERESISVREYVTLTDIKRLVDALYEQCSPDIEEP